jgi:hypothetical protein
MKSPKLIVAVVLLGVLSGLGLQQSLAKKGGTDILHYTVSTDITGDANGSVSADFKSQGNALHQSLEIDVRDLAANTTYLLRALLRGESNATDVAEFTTDANGAIQISYSEKGSLNQKKGNGGSGHGGGDPLPNPLDPVVDVLGLEIVTNGTQIVASADLANPNNFQYLVKRALQNDGAISGASGSLRLKGHSNTEQFRIRADGLEIDADYLLKINTNIVQILTSDAQGRINVSDLTGSAPNVLDITSVAILDGNTNGVLSTTLP